MAHSIENRVPYLGREFIQWVREKYNSKELINHSKINLLKRIFLNSKTSLGRDIKIPLKDLASNIFGNEFAYRPKMGFGLPLKEIFEDSKINEIFIEKYLNNLVRYFPFEKDSILSLWNNKRDNINERFSIFALACWLNINLENLNMQKKNHE